MSEIAFRRASRLFLEALIGGVSFRAHLSEREDWMGPRSRDIDSSKTALAALEASWTRPIVDLEKLKDLTAQCLRHYENDEIDAGDFATRDIDEFVAKLLEQRQ